MSLTALKNPLDTKIGQQMGKRPSGDIGIELEIEGSLKHVGEGAVYWTSKPENSLRDGIEYVLKKPTPMGLLPQALEELHQTLVNCKPNLSLRCSTHIHRNVCNLTPREVFNVLGYYFLVEDLLVKTQGKMRMGNLFCLRMSDAEVIAEDLINYAESILTVRLMPGLKYVPFSDFSMNSHKYGAVNLAAPRQFGSLEFRFLRPIIDMKVMEMWANAINDLIEKASGIPLSDTIQFVQNDSSERFLLRVFSKEFVTFLLRETTPSEAQELLLTNFDHIERLASVFKKPRKYSIPSVFLESDLENSPTIQPMHILEMDPPQGMEILDDIIEEWGPIPDDDDD